MRLGDLKKKKKTSRILPELTMQERVEQANAKKQRETKQKEERAVCAQAKREKDKEVEKNKKAKSRLAGLRQTLAFLVNHKQQQLPVDFTYKSGARIVVWKPGVDPKYCDPNYYLPMFFAGLLEEEPYNQMARKAASDVISAVGDRVLLCFPECVCCGKLPATFFCNETLAIVCSMKCKRVSSQHTGRREMSDRPPVSLITIITEMLDFSNSRQQAQLLDLVILMIKTCPAVGEILAGYSPLLKSCNCILYEEKKKLLVKGKPRKQPHDPALEKVQDVMEVLRQALQMMSALSQEALDNIKRNVPTFECFAPARHEWTYTREVRVKRVNDGRYTYDGWRRVRIRQKRTVGATDGCFYIKFDTPYQTSQLVVGKGACILKLPFSTTKVQGLLDWTSTRVDGLYDGLADNKWARLEAVKYIVEFQQHDKAPPEMMIAMPIFGVQQIPLPLETAATAAATAAAELQATGVGASSPFRAGVSTSPFTGRSSAPVSLESEKFTMRRLRDIFGVVQAHTPEADGAGSGDVSVGTKELLAAIRADTGAWEDLLTLLGDSTIGGEGSGAIMEQLAEEEGSTVSWAGLLSLCSCARNRHYQTEQDAHKLAQQSARIRAKKAATA
jgi:hypothetical protein